MIQTSLTNLNDVCPVLPELFRQEMADKLLLRYGYITNANVIVYFYEVVKMFHHLLQATHTKSKF
jgi:hypothetical protein